MSSKPIAADNSATPTCPAPARKNWLSSLSNVLVITAIIGTALTLIGFGAALSLETFGLSPTDVYSSPFDFLVLSSEVLVVLFDAFSKAFRNPEINYFWYFIVAVVCIFVVLVLHVLTHAEVRARLAGGGKESVSPHRPSAQRLSILMWSKPWIKLPLITLGAWIVSASILRFFSLLPLAIILLLISPSLMGYMAGKGTINKYVINPSKCTSLYSQKERMSPPQINQASSTEQPPRAICLRILKEGKELGRGRKIARNQDTVFLFKPVTGEVVSIPTKDAIVEQIDKL